MEKSCLCPEQQKCSGATAATGKSLGRTACPGLLPTCIFLARALMLSTQLKFKKILSASFHNGPHVLQAARQKITAQASESSLRKGNGDKHTCSQSEKLDRSSPECDLRVNGWMNEQTYVKAGCARHQVGRAWIVAARFLWDKFPRWSYEYEWMNP